MARPLISAGMVAKSISAYDMTMSDAIYGRAKRYVSADRLAANEGEFIAFAGPSFAIGMAIAIAAYLTLFYLALKHRRNVKLHAGYMLATPLILFESPFSRVIDAYLGVGGKHQEMLAT